MTYADLLERGRKLSDDERTTALRKLLLTEQAPALVAWLEDYIEREFVRAIARQDLAGHHGCVEHCAGSIYAVEKIQEELAQLLVLPGPRRPRPD